MADGLKRTPTFAAPNVEMMAPSPWIIKMQAALEDTVKADPALTTAAAVEGHAKATDQPVGGAGSGAAGQAGLDAAGAGGLHR